MSWRFVFHSATWANGNYAPLRKHYAALGSHYATLWRHNVSFRAHNFHCPSGRGAVISQYEKIANFVSPHQIQIQSGLVLLVWTNTRDDPSQPCWCEISTSFLPFPVAKNEDRRAYASTHPNMHAGEGEFVMGTLLRSFSAFSCDILSLK